MNFKPRIDCKLGLLISGLLLLCMAACVDAPDPFSSPYTNPSTSGLTGYHPVRLDLSGHTVELDAIHSVHFGSVRTYGHSPNPDGSLTVSVQGHPQPGIVDIRIQTADADILLSEAFEYQGPVDLRFETVVAIGASITQGVQRGVPSAQGSLNAPPLQVARQLGAYFPIPLLKEDFLPGLRAEDIGEAPACIIPDITQILVSQMGALMPNLTDPETGFFAFWVGREDPDMEVHNLAVGGSNLKEMIEVPDSSNFGTQFVAHLVYEPYAALLDPIENSQIDKLMALDPTLVLSFDLLYNDAVKAIVDEAVLDPSLMTAVDELRPTLDLLVAHMASLQAEVFVADLPGPCVLPAIADLKKNLIVDLIASGMSNDAAEQEAAERCQTIDATAAAYNALLYEQSQLHSWLHLVRITDVVAEIIENGLIIGDHLISLQKFGGLVGLDGVHFTNTGYALLANAFIEHINADLGTKVPLIEIDDVVNADPESTLNLLERGLDASLCH